MELRKEGHGRKEIDLVCFRKEKSTLIGEGDEETGTHLSQFRSSFSLALRILLIIYHFSYHISMNGGWQKESKLRLDYVLVEILFKD